MPNKIKNPIISTELSKALKKKNNNEKKNNIDFSEKNTQKLFSASGSNHLP